MIHDAASVLWACDQLAAISARNDGIERVYLSDEHTRCHEVVAPWFEAAGLRTWQDAAGNLCGRMEGGEEGLPAVMLASHLDTVPLAGRYDGILGVMIALAVMARFKEYRHTLPFALEVVGFSDEEGTRFGSTLLGSQAIAGGWREAWWTLIDADGVSLADAFTSFGLMPSRIADAAKHSHALVAYLEAHIEQGPYLEAQGRPLGVVTAIAGARRFEVSCAGHAGHAGTTPMAMRQDALCAASEGVLAIEVAARTYGCVATVGKLDTLAGAVNVVPGLVHFSVDIRAQDDAQRDRAWDDIVCAFKRIESARNVAFSHRETHRAAAVGCAPHLQSVIAQGIAAATGEIEPLRLVSGAGHDAMAMANITDVGMLFLRCAGGISHHPDESVLESDVALAIEAMVAAVKHLAFSHV